MADDLLRLYDRELGYLRRMAGEFSRAHPEVASHLRLSPDSIEDPHVARLIESAAFLNARVQQKLDDEFPELCNALLGVLYPHYLAPIPSFSIVQFEPSSDLTERFTLEPGATLETDRRYGEICHFRTTYAVDLLPVKLTHASLTATPFDAPRTARSTSAVAVLRLVFEGFEGLASLRELGALPLRLFLRGQPSHTLALYELLCRDVTEVAVAISAHDSRPVSLDPSCVRPVGFAQDEGLLPYPKRSFLGYRLLTEYFVFPAKFLFVDLCGVNAAQLERADRRLEVFLYLRRSSADLQQHVGVGTFALGCSPVVNLFQKRAEPVRLTQHQSEVRVALDSRRPKSMEVYSIDEVSATTPDGKRTEFRPFYGLDHGPRGESAPVFWHASRRYAASTAQQPDEGTEVYLQLADLALDPAAPADSVLSVEATCLNRDLPRYLPFGGGEPQVSMSEGGAPVHRVQCLTPPTVTLRSKSGGDALWRLISHLSLNHLSITEGAEGASALREILRMYDSVGGEANRSTIDSILSIESRAVTLRVPSARQIAFARGTEVTLHLDEQRFANHGLFLFASVLESFLGLYAAVNSFVQLVVTTNQRTGVAFQWPPRAGNRPLV
jgi:type VI secretion system protein ImpG